MSDILITVFVLIASIAFAISGTLIVRYKFGHEHLSRHNEVAGFIYAVIGVIYAVLLAFVVVVVWDDFQEADSYVHYESKTISAIYELSENFSPEFTYSIQDNLNDYLETLIIDDWKILSENNSYLTFINMPSDKYYNELKRLISIYEPVNEKEFIWYSEAIRLMSEFNENRSLRYYSTNLSVKPFIRLVIIIGGLLTVLYAMLFSSENLWSQLIIVSILSLSITLVIFLIFALDHPYQGLIKVSPESFEMILQTISKNNSSF